MTKLELVEIGSVSVIVCILLMQGPGGICPLGSYAAMKPSSGGQRNKSELALKPEYRGVDKLAGTSSIEPRDPDEM